MHNSLCLYNIYLFNISDIIIMVDIIIVVNTFNQIRMREAWKKYMQYLHTCCITGVLFLSHTNFKLHPIVDSIVLIVYFYSCLYLQILISWNRFSMLLTRSIHRIWLSTPCKFFITRCFTFLVSSQINQLV